MSLTGMHEKAQNETESISKERLKEQAARTTEALLILTLEATKLAADTLKYILKLFKDLALFLKQKTAKAAKAVRDGVSNKTKSLREFFARKTERGVKIGREIDGKELEQAQKFIQLLNTPAGAQAPAGLENTTIAPWGKKLIVVDRHNQVKMNLIQPLMDSQVIQAAMNENLVQSAIAPGIEPLKGSLASYEADLQASLIANNAIEKAESRLDTEIYQELEALLEQPSEVRLETEVPAVELDEDGIVIDPFQEIEPASVITPVEVVSEVENQPDLEQIPAAVTPQLCSELVTIAQLHQVGTQAQTSSLPLARKNGIDLEMPSLLTQTNKGNGETNYEFQTPGANSQKFSFTVNPDRIITSFNIDRRNDPQNIRKLIASAANIVTDPDRTDFQPHPESNSEAIATLQALNTSLRELEAATEKPVSTAEVTLDDRKFGVKTSKRDRTVVVSEKATTATMTATVNGIEDGGLLKIMMQGARNGGVLATKFIEMAQEKANRIKTLVGNATPQIMEVVSEGVNRDREGKIAAQKAVERIGADLDGLIGTVQTTIATSPALAGTVGKMKRIERVEAGEERQVEAIVDAPPSIEQPQVETPEQIGLQERLNVEVAQNYQPQADTKANARSQQAQSSL